MKKLLLILFLTIGCIFYSNAQSSDVLVVHQRFDDVVFGNTQTNTYLRFSVFVVKQEIDEPGYKYKYEIMVVNHSHYYGNGSRIYMSGIRVYANKMLISNDYQNGFWSLIPYEEPISIYWYKISDSNINFSITWENIQHY